MNTGKKDIIDREIEDTEKQIALEVYKTALKKQQFVNEIKNGLGEKIKSNPNKVTIVKKNKFVTWVKKIFTKF